MNKYQALADLITRDQHAALKASGLDCQSNLDTSIAQVVPGPKYTKIDIGIKSGRYMVENSTEKIFGIKAYGVIHRGHQYGTLDTMHEWNWGFYTAYRLTKPK